MGLGDFVLNLINKRLPTTSCVTTSLILKSLTFLQAIAKVLFEFAYKLLLPVANLFQTAKEEA